VTLEFEACEHEDLPLWDFGFVDATRYTLRGEHAPERPAEVLSELVRSPVYRNNFIEPESFKHDPGPIHGPFRADQIEASDYETLSFEALCDDIRRRLADPSFSRPPSDEQRESVGALLARIKKTALHCFHLKLNRSDDSHRHDWWFVYTIFHEYIILEHRGLWLLVLGYD